MGLSLITIFVVVILITRWQDVHKANKADKKRIGGVECTKISNDCGCRINPPQREVFGLHRFK